MSGSLMQRSPGTWRLKYEAADRDTPGKRKICYATFKGNKRQAQMELTRLIALRDSGAAIEPDRITVADYLRSWLSTAEALTISPKTAERYRELINYQIVPHLGTIPLQKLKGVHIATWHATLMRAGGRRGEPLSPRTVGHAHRLAHKAFGDAAQRELLVRNPRDRISPPKVAAKEMEILGADQIKVMLDAISSSAIFPQVVVLVCTGMRRGELMGLQWGDVDLDGGKLRVERSIETTRAGLRIRPPKTASGRRLLSLPGGWPYCGNIGKLSLKPAWPLALDACQMTPSSSATLSRAKRAILTP